jgi:hypothetical protein
MDDDGVYEIDDSNAQVRYRANPVRDWSPHLNASDMLANFVQYAGSLGVKREDVMDLPIHLFLAWLIIEAAERDGDPVEEPPLIENPAMLSVIRPRCQWCGRYISRRHHRHGFAFCNLEHAKKKFSLSA